MQSHSCRLCGLPLNTCFMSISVVSLNEILIDLVPIDGHFVFLGSYHFTSIPSHQTDNSLRLGRSRT